MYKVKVKVLVVQSCPTLCNPMDCSPPTFSGILQARILEWVSIPFSRGSSQPRVRTQVSCIAGGFFTISVTRETLKKGIYIYIYIYTHIHTVLDLFHYRLLQYIEYSSLCYTVGPYCLSVLYIIVYICKFKLLIYPPFSPSITISLFSVSASPISVF